MKKGVIIALVVLIVLGITGVVTIFIVNNQAEEKIVSVLNEAIISKGLEDAIKYDSVNIASTKGSMVLNGFNATNEDFNIAIDKIEVKLPLAEAVSIAKDPNTTKISKMDILISDMSYSDHLGKIKLNQDEFVLNFEGLFNTELLKTDYIPNDGDLIVEKLDFKNGGISLSTEIGEMSFNNFKMKFLGNLNISELDEILSDNGMLGFTRVANSFGIDIEEFKFEAEQEIIEAIAMLSYLYLGNASFIGEQENWTINKLVMDSTLIEDTLSVDSLIVDTNWINFNAIASISIDEKSESFTPFSFKVNMNSYIDDLRPFFEMFVSEITTEELPENQFSLDFSLLDSQSYPDITIEEL